MISVQFYIIIIYSITLSVSIINAFIGIGNVLHLVPELLVVSVLLIQTVLLKIVAVYYLLRDVASVVRIRIVPMEKIAS